MQNNNKKNLHLNSSIDSSSSIDKSKKIEGKKKLTGIQKAAILIVSMGSQVSSEVFKHLSEDEIQELLKEIVKIKSVDKKLKNEVLEEFKSVTTEILTTSKGGKDIARKMLQQSFGDEKAKKLIEKMERENHKPLEPLNKADPIKIAKVLNEEHPQTIAIVLSSIEPKVASKVLANLSESLKSDIIKRIATIQKSNKDLLYTLEKSLIQKLENLPTESDQVGGIDAIANILNSSLSEKASQKILEDLEDTDRELVDAIKRKLINYDDIILLLDRDIQLILSQLDSETIAKALKLSNDEIKERIISNLSKRILKEEIEPILNSGPIRLRDIQEAQNKILTIMRELINNKKISFAGDYVE